MFQHWDRLDGSGPACALILLVDTHVPISDCPDTAVADELGVVVRAATAVLVGASTVVVFSVLQALAHAMTAIAVRRGSGTLFFIWLIRGLRNRMWTNKPVVRVREKRSIV
jgi:hypothetical protein